MAIVRKKNKQTGSVSWLSLTTALLELERDLGIDDKVCESKLRQGVVLESYYAAYEYMD